MDRIDWELIFLLLEGESLIFHKYGRSEYSHGTRQVSLVI